MEGFIKLLGLSVVESAELTGFVLAVIAFGVFLGNIFSACLIKFIDLFAEMLNLFFDWSIKRIKGKLHK